MFGYVTLYRKGLADAEMDRYQAYYCGLCRTLGRRYGRTGQLALSYDMAFVAILLTALYDTPTAFSEGRCAQQFEMLPILKDTPEGKLLYNTIYSGVWSKYALVRKHREAKRHD